MKKLITISREYGSGGRIIGKLLAEKLGVPFYDKLIIDKAVEESGFSRELIEMLNNKTIIPGEKGDDCFKKGNYIYITNKYFGIKLREKFKQTFSAKRVSAYFNERYISEVYPDNRQKRYNNKRYLKLNMTELVKDSKDSSAYINNLFYR